MSLPRIGVSLPTFGPHAGPEAVVTIAQAAESFGFHGVSATERLLLPARPDWRNEIGLPESYVWDPVEMLTWAAAHTERIRVSTAVINALFQPPIVLARRLATLDRLSHGRLDVGIGQGGGGTAATNYCLPEEFEASGVSTSLRGAGFVEYLAALRACWAPDPVEHHGEHYQIPLATIGPKPWADTIPLFLGAVTRPTVERAARIADGFTTVAFDWDLTTAQTSWYRDAGGTGTVVARWIPTDLNPQVSPPEFAASARKHLDHAAAADVDELHVELNLADTSPERQTVLLEAFAGSLSR